MLSKVRKRRSSNNSINHNINININNNNHKDDDEDDDNDLRNLLRRFWQVTAPFWFSDDKLAARLQLAAVFALTLSTTAITVAFNFLGRDFYNALANKDSERFKKQLFYYLASFAGGIPIFVLRDYARETLSLRWRSWMTKYYMDRYLKDQTFYKIQSQSIIDNPDQRIVDDLSSFTRTALSFALTLLSAVIDLISFSNILFGIYPPLFLVLLLYSIGGTAISVFLGKGLVTLNFLQEKKEADFRYGLVRVRENAESIAFYSGEEKELHLLLQRFRNAFENLTQLLISSRNLDFFTKGYRHLIQILPAAVVAPMYFSGKIEFGVINQSVSAFNHILEDLSLIVYQFKAMSAFSAVIDRLGEFDDILNTSSSKGLSDSSEGINLVYSNISNGTIPTEKCRKLLEIEKLTLKTPMNETTLIRDLSLTIDGSSHLLVMGPSGCGKTSLLRVMAGLWRSGKGNITFHVTSLEENAKRDFNGVLESTRRRSRDVFFLPQRPYMVLGTLRQQLLYPTWTEDVKLVLESTKFTGSLPFLMGVSSLEIDGGMSDKPSTHDLIKVLEDVHLGHIFSRLGSLDSVHEWSSVLSLGEQQRLAFARLLLSRPKLVLLDEATSALDESNEAHLYQKISVAGITYISIGHRRTLLEYHNRILHISTLDPDSNEQNWKLESINRKSSYGLSKQ